MGGGSGLLSIDGGFKPSAHYGIPLLVQDQSSFYEIRSLGMCLSIKVFNRLNRKRLNILKIFLEYLQFYIVVY